MQLMPKKTLKTVRDGQSRQTLTHIRRETDRARHILQLADDGLIGQFLDDEKHYAATGSLDCKCPNCPRSKP